MDRYPGRFSDSDSILCRWDLFPGISAAQSANGKHEAASKQTQSSQGSQPSALPVPEKDRSEPKRGTSDLLARTFDIMDLQAAE